MRRVLVVLFIIVAAAGLATLLVQQGFINPSPIDRPLTPADTRPSSGQITPTGEAIRTSPRAGTTVGRATASSASFQSVDESPLTLDGELVESSGAPVIGAVITLAVDLSMPPFSVVDGPVRASATSDDAGRFRFDSIPRGFPWVMTASHPDLASHRRVLGLLRGNVAPIRLVMGQGTTLRCIVKDGAGAPLAGVSIEVRSEGAPEDAPPKWTGTSGAQGILEIKHVSAGNQLVRTTSTSYVPAQVSITTRGEGATVDVPLKLVRGSPLAGEVVNADGSPLDAGVCEASAVGGPRSLVSTPVIGGRFEFTALLPGLHALVVRTRNGGVTAPVNANLPVEPSSQPIRLVMPARGSIEVSVMGTDGRPAADAMAWLQSQPDPHTGRPERVTWVGNESGLVTFQNVRPGRYWAVARSGTGPPVVSGHLDVGPSGSVTTTIRLTQGLLLYGVVRNVEGKPIEGVEVRVRPQSISADERPLPQLPGKAWSGSCMTDADGKWWLRVVPGPIRLIASHQDFIEATGPVVSLPIAVEAMAPDITLHRAATILGTVTASAGGPDPSATISAWVHGVENPSVLSVTTNGEGAYSFRGLTPGRWCVKIVRRDGIFLPGSDEPGAAKIVDVSVDAPVRIDF